MSYLSCIAAIRVQRRVYYIGLALSLSRKKGQVETGEREGGDQFAIALSPILLELEKYLITLEIPPFPLMFSNVI